MSRSRWLNSATSRAAIALVVTMLATTQLWASQRPAPTQPDREHGCSIVGVVIDASGKRVANATVTLTDSVTQEVKTYKAAKNGQYEIIKLFPGVYTLQANADSRQSDLSQIKVSNNAVTKQDLKVELRK